MRRQARYACLAVLGLVTLVGCKRQAPESESALAWIAPGWQSELIATVQQSYAGWDVEIGDADNDGLRGLGPPPASGVYVYRLKAGKKVLQKRMMLLK